VLAELEQVLEKLRDEVNIVREKNRRLSRNNQNDDYSQNTMYMVGIYKAMSIVSDIIRSELDAMDMWSDDESKRIND
jgi:hypothetical protein|tara:strand:- start:3171 stop:3401 length:231 start_codon:yes stop_codon:yes gene_type:complete